MTGEGKIPAVKIEFVEFGKNDKVIIRTPCQGLIKKIKMISGRRWNPKGNYNFLERILSLIPTFILSPSRRNFP